MTVAQTASKSFAARQPRSGGFSACGAGLPITTFNRNLSVCGSMTEGELAAIIIALIGVGVAMWAVVDGRKNRKITESQVNALTRKLFDSNPDEISIVKQDDGTYLAPAARSRSPAPEIVKIDESVSAILNADDPLRKKRIQ